LFYIYPEGMLISAVLFFPFLVWRVVYDVTKHCQVRAYISLFTVVVALAAPYVAIFCSFLISQLGAAGGGLHAGAGIFTGLLSPALLPAMFGLAQEFNGTTFSIWNHLLPWFLILLMTTALFFWWRSDRSLFFCLPFLILFAAWQGVFQRYDYGLFKTLL